MLSVAGGGDHDGRQTETEAEMEAPDRRQGWTQT